MAVCCCVVVVVVVTELNLEHDEEAHGDRETQEIQHWQAMGHKDRRRRRSGHADRCHPRESASSSFRLNSCPISSRLQLISELNR